MFTARGVVNSLSLSRIGLALMFVLCFQRRPALLYISCALCVIAFTTDILDGYLARRWNVASVHGRQWDSLGDKAFYIAIIVAFSTQGFLNPLLSWALLVREVAHYIFRILYIEKLPMIERIRPFTNLHGYFMYGTIILGLSQMYVQLSGLSVTIYPYTQISASAALVFGVASIVHFLKLR